MSAGTDDRRSSTACMKSRSSRTARCQMGARAGCRHRRLVAPTLAPCGVLAVDGHTLHASTSLLPRPTTSRITPTTSGSRALICRRCNLYNAARGRRFNLGARAHIVASRDDANPVAWRQRDVFCKIYSVETGPRQYATCSSPIPLPLRPGAVCSNCIIDTGICSDGLCSVLRSDYKPFIYLFFSPKDALY
jgi:hypothetical protein